MNLRVRRPDSDKANLARNGPVVQGHQPFITALTHQNHLITDHFTAIARKQIEGNYVMRYEPAKVYLESTCADGPNGAHTRIDPIHWEGGPTPDGDTSDFEKTLARCQKYLHHFAMHTAHCFMQALPTLEKVNPRVLEQATRAAKPSGGGEKRRRKREAPPDTDVDEAGWFRTGLVVCVNTDFSSHPRG